MGADMILTPPPTIRLRTPQLQAPDMFRSWECCSWSKCIHYHHRISWQLHDTICNSGGYGPTPYLQQGDTRCYSISTSGISQLNTLYFVSYLSSITSTQTANHGEIPLAVIPWWCWNSNSRRKVYFSLSVKDKVWYHHLRFQQLRCL